MITIIKSFELSNSNENDESGAGKDDKSVTKNFQMIDKQLADISSDLATKIKQSKISLIKSLQQVERRQSEKNRSNRRQAQEFALDAMNNLQSLKTQHSTQNREKAQSEMSK